MSTDKLAIHGGTPVRTKPLPAGKKVGAEELKELADVIESGETFRWSGTKVKQFEREFAELMGAKYAVACTSGTASIHVAVGMVNPSPGDEIITAPITDIGTVIPILYQTAIPVFADVDPETFNLDAASVERCVNERTKAIIVVHLMGNPADMDGILAVARRHGLRVIEDCAQAHQASYRGKPLGTIGDIGCFSLQGSKHMTTGDGGITITDDEDLAGRGMLFADKGWKRVEFGPREYVVFGPNYRMTELQGAVACAQTRKVRDIVARRRRNGDRLRARMADAPGIRPQKRLNRCEHAYWLFGLIVDHRAGYTADDFVAAMRAEGIPCSAHYIGKPIFLCHEAVRTQRLFGDSRFPFDHPRARQGIRYDETTCPIAQDVLDGLVVL